LNLLYCFYLVVVIDGTFISLGYFGINIPLNLFALIALGILCIAVFGGYSQSKWSLWILILASGGTFTRYVQGSVWLSDRTGTDVERIMVMVAFVVSFSFGVLITLPMLVDGKNRIISKLFLVKLADFKNHAGVLFTGFLGILITYVLTAVFVREYFVQFYLVKPLHAFVMSSVLKIFYYSLIDQLICFGLAKYVLDSFFREEETSMWEIVLYAGLFAGFHFYLLPAIIFREFVMGLFLSYMFLKTKSLTYGIILYSLFYIFTSFIW